MLHWRDTAKRKKKKTSRSPSQPPLYLQLPTVLIYNRETTEISGETTLLAGFLTPFFTLSTEPFSWFLARGTLTRGTKRMLLSLRWRCCQHGSAPRGDGLAALVLAWSKLSSVFIQPCSETSVQSICKGWCVAFYKDSEVLYNRVSHLGLTDSKRKWYQAISLRSNSLPLCM